MPAAKAAWCSGQQKPALFWNMHDWLFQNQAQWTSSPTAAQAFRTQALAFGVDGAQYDACLTDAKTEPAIMKEEQAGTDAGVSGTPAFFVNDWFVSGAAPFDTFQKTIDKALAGKHPAPTATPLPQDAIPYAPNPQRPGFTLDGSPAQGQGTAPLVLITFEDMKCAECATWSTTIEPQVVDKYIKTGQIYMVMKFVSGFAGAADHADLAAICAADQNKFWEFRAALYAHESEWKDGDNTAMLNYAKGIGLDEAKFKQCLDDETGQAQLDADAGLVQQLQLNTLPYFLLINAKTGGGMRIPVAVTTDQLDTAMQQVLNPPTPTPEATAGAAAPAQSTPAATQPAATATPGK